MRAWAITRRKSRHRLGSSPGGPKRPPGKIKEKLMRSHLSSPSKGSERARTQTLEPRVERDFLIAGKGARYLLRILRCRWSDNRRDGAVMTIQDAPRARRQRA